MNIGKLNQRIKVYRISNGTPDGLGGFTGAGWVHQLDTWANVRQVKSSRTYNIGQLSFDMLYEIQIRSRKNKQPGDFDSADFDPIDFNTAVYAGLIDENYSIVHEGRRIILHSVVEQNDTVFKIVGYFRRT